MRFISSFAVAVLLTLPVTAMAQQADGDTVASANEVRAHVEFLADDLLEGRLPGTDGYQMAAHYVATRFSALGLRPAGDEGGWFQKMDLVEYQLDENGKNQIDIGRVSFPNEHGVIINPNYKAENISRTIEGEAIFVGNGYSADYRGVDARGKFVVVLNLATRSAGVKEEGDRQKVAADHGALGLLYLMPDAPRRAPGSKRRARTDWLDRNGIAGEDADRIDFVAYLQAPAATTLLRGAKMSAAQVFAAAKRGTRTIRPFAIPQVVRATRTNHVRRVPTSNVIGVLPGSDETLAAEYVILSAHLDHLGSTSPKNEAKDTIYNGAMDNAVGVATMLEAARSFVRAGTRPKRSIMFAALTSEEKGLWGSQFLAKYPVDGARRIVAAVNLDMPILQYDFKDVVAFGAERSTLGPIVEQAAAQAGVALSSDPLPEERLFTRSDHFSFVKMGIPSVFLITGFQNGGEKAFRDFLKTRYHTVSDDLNQPFNWAAGAKFARINYLIARGIADAPETPKWYEGDEFGALFAPGSIKVRPAAHATRTSTK